MTRSIRNLALTLLFLALLFFLLQRFGAVPSLKDLFAPRSLEIAQTPLLVKQIREVAQLMTIELYDEVVVDSVKKPSVVLSPGIGVFPLPPVVLARPASLVLIVKGRVLAGTNLQLLHEQNIRISGDSVTIQLPRAQILDVIINPSDVETFAEQGNWTPNEVTALKLKARVQLTRDAHEQQILARANEKARSLVEQLLKSSGFQHVTVTTAGS